MLRKGTSYLFKIGFPTPPPERRALEAKKTTFKDNWEYLDPSLEELPLLAPPAPAQNADEDGVPLDNYCQIGVSAIDGCIASVEEKVDQVIGNPDIGSSSVKKMARKLGREQKFLKSVKADIECLATNEAAHEEHGLEQPVEQGVDEQGVQAPLEQDAALGPGVEPAQL